ncbi:DUF2939 domain-containing protein [Caulobacter sp. 602-1]|uniref:DUF2939 domain-containing protein n=1 Tax=Caulobacter sp. 602-1 TaxID=2492472 RepID=UPI000F6308CF|nr:DUF2939 domain-containing protein [Caulobacter sp. 602-1]RRN63063.1 DUF2939 domain-containing protein [Caulobacter sp. 602-1]
MTRSNRILTGVGLGVLAALVIAGYFASPILALQGLTAAAKAGDKARLESAVDFPAVRESLKSQLKASMTRKVEEDPKLRDNPFAAFGQMLLVGVVDKAVDTYATPDAIANMVATNEPPKSISATPGGPVIEQPQPEVKKPKAKSDTEVRYGYVDLDHFRATYRDRKDGDQEPFGLVLERRGLFKWKLVKIELSGLN